MPVRTLSGALLILCREPVRFWYLSLRLMAKAWGEHVLCISCSHTKSMENEEVYLPLNRSVMVEASPIK